MRTFAAALFASVAVASINVSELEQILQGIVVGALDEAVPSFGDCFADAEKMIGDVEDAVKDFKKGSFSSIKSGIYAVGDAVGDFGTTLQTCESSVQDAEKLVDMASKFSNPWSYVFHIGKDILLNGVDIYGYVTAATTAWDSGDYYTFGVNVGEALDAVFIGETNGPACFTQ